MYQIKAVLGNQAKPELGVVTVPFPIPRQEYEQILELLKGLKIGASVSQDCQVETIDSHYSILKRMEGTSVNLDELDYLAKRLDSFDGGEALQFQAAAAAKDMFIWCATAPMEGPGFSPDKESQRSNPILQRRFFSTI